MKIEKSANHSHFYTQDRVVYEMLTTGYSRLIRKLDFYYPNWTVLSDQAVIYLNTNHNHHPEYKPEISACVNHDAEDIKKHHEKPKKTMQMDLFSL